MFSWNKWGWSSEDSSLLIGFGGVWVTTCVPSQIWLPNLNKPIKSQIKSRRQIKDSVNMAGHTGKRDKGPASLPQVCLGVLK